jgi:hypothetical protein
LQALTDQVILYRPEYFVRSIKDTGALDYGVASELPAILGAHPIEDVMHLGSWIQLYTILHSGTKPDEFQCFPTYNGRTPELVCGRTYPLLGVNPENSGTICLGPDNRGDTVRITYKPDPAVDVWAVVPLFDVKNWYDRITRMEMMVAPLVFRHYAVFRDPTNPSLAPFVAVDFNTRAPPPHDVSRYPVDLSNPTPIERQFLDSQGRYSLMKAMTNRTFISFVEAHENLLPIGTFMLVESSSIQQFGLGSPKQWIRGSLRYPDETLEEDDSDEAQLRIYVTIRIRTRPGDEDEVRVIYAPPTNCRIFAETRITEAEYSVDAVRQIIRIQGAAISAV